MDKSSQSVTESNHRQVHGVRNRIGKDLPASRSTVDDEKNINEQGDSTEGIVISKIVCIAFAQNILFAKFFFYFYLNFKGRFNIYGIFENHRNLPLSR